MINANQLRIGNWVIADHHESGRNVSEVKELNDRLITVQNKYLEGYAPKCCHPIPLTPDILEKCGAVKSSIENPFFSHYDFFMPRDRHLSVSNPGTPNEMVMILEKNKNDTPSVVCVRNFDYDGKTYLHQLQNIFFALTGEELTYNP